MAVIPLLVYFLAYVPYLQLGHPIAGPSAGPGYGWSLDEIHAQMFGYHFGLQAGHPSSSPWWSWPLDLKPVWFYGHDFDERRIGVIYNGQLLAIFPRDEADLERIGHLMLGGDAREKVPA